MNSAQQTVAMRKLDGLAEKYGTDVFGDGQIGILVKEIPELAEYQEIFRRFAERGLYDEVLKNLDKMDLDDLDLLEMVVLLGNRNVWEDDIVEWTCRLIWQVVKGRSTGDIVAQIPECTTKPVQSKQPTGTPLRSKKRRTKYVVLSVAQILLGVALLVGIVYYVGLLNLLTRLPENIWNLFPTEMMKFLQDAPRISSLWILDRSALDTSLILYVKTVLLSGLYAGAVIGSIFCCIVMLVSAPEAARRRLSLKKRWREGKELLVTCLMGSVFWTLIIYGILSLG